MNIISIKINMKNFAYLLFGLFLIVLTSEVLRKTVDFSPTTEPFKQNQRQKQKEQSGGGIPDRFYKPILPTGKGCNKTPDAPGLAYSSLYTSDLPRSIDFPGRTQDQYYSSQKTPAPFDPPCLTGKPYGNAMAIYNYWKYLPNLLESQYLECDKYKCANHTLNGYEALPRLEKCTQTKAGKVEPGPTLACDVVNQQYYNSSEDFCRDHPEHYPCANWWMNNPVQIRDVSRADSAIGHLPKNIKVTPSNPPEPNTEGFCLSGDPNCQLTDGKALLMIQRHREDQGLC